MSEVIDEPELAAPVCPWALPAAPTSVPLGITSQFPSHHYHADRSAVSSSQLKRILISPAHFQSLIDEPDEPSEALLFGSVLHVKVLEPDCFKDRFYAMPKIDRRTKEGKASAERHEASAAGRTLFPETWLPQLECIAESVRQHSKAASILAEGQPEVTISWIDPETGIKCKVRLDWWQRPGFVADLKSACDVTASEFGYACGRMGYALSAAMYLEGIFEATGEEPDWAFIACEKAKPFTVMMYRPTEAFLRRGRDDLRRALRRLAECRSAGVYPPLQAHGDWEPLDLPRRWA